MDSIATARVFLEGTLPQVLARDVERYSGSLSPLGIPLATSVETEAGGSVRFAIEDHRLVFVLSTESTAASSGDPVRAWMESTVILHADDPYRRRLSKLSRIPVEQLTRFWVEQQVLVFLRTAEKHLEGLVSSGPKHAEAPRSRATEEDDDAGPSSPPDPRPAPRRRRGVPLSEPSRSSGPCPPAGRRDFQGF